MGTLPGVHAQCITISSVLVQNENCGQANGQIHLVHDGTAPFTYAWSHNAALNDSVATGLAAGTYTVAITDAVGCQGDTTLTLLDTGAPTASPLSFSNPSCEGSADGSAIITTKASNTVSWNSTPPQSGLVLNNVPAGTYIATITDSLGCTTTLAVNLVNPPAMGLAGTTLADTCGAPNGRATVNVVGGGTAPFSYQWNANAGNQSTQTATGLRGGKYSVTVTDANNCSSSTELTVGTRRNGFGGTVEITAPSCFGDTDGQVRFVGVGGNGTYSVDWIDSDQNVLGSGLIFNNVSSGSFQAVATDPNGSGCEARVTFFMPQPTEIRTGFRIIPASDCRAADGVAYVAPTGGTPPYSAAWSNGSLGDTLRNLLPDILFVTVTDAKGCEATDRVVVTSAPGPLFAAEVLQGDDCGLGEGIVRLNMELGTPPYEVIWNTNSPQANDSSLIAFNLFGTGNSGYSVIVIDADSCIAFQSIEVPGNEPLELVESGSVAEYCNLANGEAFATFRGGTPPYTYRWSTFPIQTSPRATGLVAGTYEVTLRDALNCTFSTRVTVGQVGGFSLEVIATDESCYGQGNGTARVLVQGGRGPFQYTWSSSPVQNAAEALNLSEGAYTVTVIDNEGCQRSDFGVVSAVDRVRADFTVSPDSIFPVSLTDAFFRFNNQSQGADQYRWSFGDGSVSTEFSPVHAYVDTGQYFVQLIAFSNNGQCADTVQRGPFGIVQDGVIHVPTAFSPNRDGINDQFFVRGQEVIDYELQVFGRWGNTVYRSRSLSDTWDGTLLNGGAAPEGVYVYLLQAVLIAGEPVRRTGTITLLR